MLSCRSCLLLLLLLWAFNALLGTCSVFCPILRKKKESVVALQYMFLVERTIRLRVGYSNLGVVTYLLFHEKINFDSKSRYT